MSAASFALLALTATAPLAWGLGHGLSLRGRRDASLALHRGQLAELDRDAGDGRLSAEDHASARLEVQRRLLAAAGSYDAEPVADSRALVLSALLALPLAGAGLYLLNGRPERPAAPLSERVASGEIGSRREMHLRAALRDRLVQFEPGSDQARRGFVLFGDAENSRGNLAAAAWRSALAIQFDRAVTMQAAEAQARLDGRVAPETAALLRRALAAGPSEAPWRALVQRRLAEAK